MSKILGFTPTLVIVDELEEEDPLPPYGKPDWLLVNILHDPDSQYFPLEVEEYGYGGLGSCFWIQEETGFNWWINQFFSHDTLAEGWWVIENITADYIRGDGWQIDDDVEYDFGFVRPATEEEIAALNVVPCNLKE